MKRFILACSAIVVVALVATPRAATQAPVPPFLITGINCTSTPGHVFVTNESTATTPVPLAGLGVRFSSASGTVAGPIKINEALAPGGDFSVLAGANLDLQVGSGATTSPAAPTSPANLPTNQTVALTTQPLLQPGTTVSLVDMNNGNALIDTAVCPGVGISRTLTVSTAGFDVIAPGVPNSICGPDLTAGVVPTPANPGPCFTIQNALFYARDGDTIVVESGIYEICSTITVDKLVNITAGSNTSPGNAKVILHSFAGQTVFHVIAIGASVGPSNQSQHAAINGLAIGGAFQPAAGAIFLDYDAYTDVTNNVLGGEPLNNPAFTGAPCLPNSAPVPPGSGLPAPTVPKPVAKSEVFGNAANIILSNSDHPNISNNSILGSAIFKFSPVLAVGDVLTGFGIVTAECLGISADASDSVTIASNLIDRNTNAGIWMCSDGGGLHNFSKNAVRNNGRGIVLRAIADSVLDGNTISDDYQDGIVIYDAAENNTISNNIIESHRTAGAAGIRLGDFGGGVYPLATVVTDNKVLRNWIGIDIAGARNTSGTGNTITAERIRTAVLLEVGSAGDVAITQPTGTVLHQNVIITNGGCFNVQGCAIRLAEGVSTNVDAGQNNFGLPAETDVNTVLWHKPNDPSLGCVFTGIASPVGCGNPPATATSTSSTPTTGATPASATPVATGTPPTATASPTSTPAH